MRIRAATGWLLLVQACLSSVAYGQEISPDALLLQLHNDLRSEQEANRGRVVWDDETSETYFRLVDACAVERLAAYTDDSIPALRARLFAELARKGADATLLRQIFARHAFDTARFVAGSGCTTPEWTVRAYMELALPRPDNSRLPPINCKARIAALQNRAGIRIPGVHHRLVSKDSLLQLERLRYSGGNLRIVGFTFRTNDVEIRTGNAVTGAVRSAINALRPGDPFLFDDIRAELPDGRIVRVNPIVLRIRL